MIIKRKVLVYGCFGYFNNQLDGQTIKTRAIYDLLKKHYTGDTLSFDSLEIRFKKSLIFKLLRFIFQTRIVLFVGARHNYRYVFPFFFILSKVLRFKITYIAIGGWLNEELNAYPLHRWMIAHINGILVENEFLRRELKSKFGIKDIKTIPNFRTTTDFYARPSDGKLKLVFMARINKMKGIDSMRYLAQHIDKIYPKGKITIDFFGPIKESDKDYFFKELIDEFEFINYRGAINPEDIVVTLQKYDTLILPTHYYTEGFPGSILDAYRASLPVIVTNWKFASEFVKDNKTGYIVSFEKCEKQLCEKVDYMFNNQDLILKLKKYSYLESLKYTPDKAWKILSQYLK